MSVDGGLMRRLFTIVAVLLILALCIISCIPTSTPTLAPVTEPAPAPAPASAPASAPTSNPSIPAHFTTYTDDSGFFSVSYPSDWEPFPSKFEGIVPFSKNLFKGYDSDVSLTGLFFVFLAELPAEPNTSSPNINIVVQSLSDMTSRGWWTLDEIVEAKLQRTEEIRQDYHEFSRLNTIIGGKEAVIIDWGNSVPDSGKKARTVQMFMIADKLVWKVTCYVDSENYDYFRSDLYDIVRSLRILR